MVAAITGGEIEVTGARTRDLEVIAAPLLRMGLDCRYDDDRLTISPFDARTRRSRITTGLWPGFPSDMVSLVTVLATQAAGRTLVHDWLYELRLFALEQLSAMRADFFLCDPHRIIVTGPTKLRGRALDSRDLRSGMALIAAALAADGESRVSPLETVERGYARLVDRLVSLGAQVRTRGRDSRLTAWRHCPGCPLRPAPPVEDAGIYGRRPADDRAGRRRQYRRLRRRPRGADARAAVSGCRSDRRGG